MFFFILNNLAKNTFLQHTSLIPLDIKIVCVRYAFTFSVRHWPLVSPVHWSLSSTMWLWPRPISVPSFISTRSAVCHNACMHSSSSEGIFLAVGSYTRARSGIVILNTVVVCVASTYLHICFVLTEIKKAYLLCNLQRIVDVIVTVPLLGLHT